MQVRLFSSLVHLKKEMKKEKVSQYAKAALIAGL